MEDLGVNRAVSAAGQIAGSILVFGSSGHASVVIDILERWNVWKIAGLIDPYVATGARVMGYEVLGHEGELPELVTRAGAVSGIIAIGDNFLRSSVERRILSMVPGFSFVTAIHPSAQLGREVRIGAGSAVMAGAVINSRARIGAHCIVNTSASVDHDCDVSDFAHLAPNATLGGGVKVGEFAFIGQSATVIHNVQVGRHSVVGAGAVVLKDVPPLVVAHGVPASVSRSRKEGERYL